MINAYLNERGHLGHIEQPEALAAAVWIDLEDPSDAEEQLVEDALGVDVPTREEMEEIEVSSRLYYEDSAAFMTVTLPAQTDTDEPILAPVSFVLAGERLITVRYHMPHAFKSFPERAPRIAVGDTGGAGVLVTLLEIQVDRLADVLERLGRDVHGISGQVFQHRGSRPTKSDDLRVILEAIGRKGDVVSNILESLVSLNRMFGFLSHSVQDGGKSRDLRTRIKTLSRDCRSLMDHAGSLTSKVTFLLDATLGLINIEQNAIIKIFSVAAAAFLPPTLIASIYGMNFEFMPELEWPLGYPLALLLMVVSAVVPLWYFRRRGWL